MSTKTHNNLVTVIIPAYNEQAVIGKNLLALKNQSYKDIEIIVVDDASMDDTFRISKRYTSRVYRRKHQDRSAQRNFGAFKAKGDYLLFLDADMELSKDVINECVGLSQSNPKIGAIAIPEISIANYYWEKVKAFERSFYNESGDKFTDAPRFFTKKSFNDARGFDEKITGPEDWDLPDRVRRLGFEVGRVSAVIYHFERVPNPFSVAKKKFKYGLKSYRYFEKNKISPVSPKTIYFLRPVFYKNWKKIILHPVLSFSMLFMLTLEQFAGGLGYIIGKYRKL